MIHTLFGRLICPKPPTTPRALCSGLLGAGVWWLCGGCRTSWAPQLRPCAVISGAGVLDSPSGLF